MSKGKPPSEENLALVANTMKFRRGRWFPSRKNQDKRPGPDCERKKIDMSKIRCYEYQKTGHFARDCIEKRKNFRRRHHASTTDIDDEPQKKKSKESNLDKVAKDIRKEYYPMSSLFGSMSCSGETWLVDSGASRHMIGYQSALINLTEKNPFVHVELRDDATYAIQGVGSTSFQLDSGIVLHIEDILFVLRLKKSLLFQHWRIKVLGLPLWMERPLYGLRMET